MELNFIRDEIERMRSLEMTALPVDKWQTIKSTTGEAQ
jgi:hypothetical protein